MHCWSGSRRFVRPERRISRNGSTAATSISDADVAFLQRVMSDSEEIKRYVEKVPEVQALYGRAVNLYHEIMQKALENEQNS